MSYDPKCWELAEYFLGVGASHSDKQALAQDFQNMAEIFAAVQDARKEPVNG